MDRRPESELLREIETLRQQLKAYQAREAESGRAQPLIEARRESEEQLSSIYYATGDVIFLLDVEQDGEYRFATVNPAFLSSTGLPAESVIGKSVRDVIPEPSLAQVLSHYRQAVQERTIVRWEETSEYPTGKRTALVTVAPITEADGTCRRLVGNVHDITERKRVEAALAESQALLESIVNSTTDMIWAVDSRHFGLLTYNDTVRDYFLTRYGIQIESGMRPDDLVPRADLAQPWYQLYRRALEAGSFTTEYSADPGTITRQLNFNVLRRQGEVFGISVFGKDITERKRAEKALRESEERYKLMFEAAPIAINITRGTTVTYANPSYLEMFGFSNLDELKSYAPLQLFSPEWRPQILENIERRAKGLPAPSSYEAECLRTDGTRIPILMYLARAMFEDGPATVAFIVNITQRKRAEEALRESELRYKSLFENNHAVMLIVDPDSAAIVDANPAACAYYGWNRDQLLQRRIDEINILSAAEVQAELQVARAEKRSPFFFKHRRADGSVRDVEVYSGPIGLRGKTLLYSIIHDITERKQAESQKEAAMEALRLSENKFSQAFHGSPGIFAITTLAEGRFVDVNDSFLQSAGYTREQVIGRTVFELNLWADPEQGRQLRRLLQEHGAVSNFDSTYRRQGGEIGFGLISAAIIDVGGQPCLLTETIDITERKQAEEALRQLNAELEERVAQRTAQLDNANDELNAVIGELNTTNQELNAVNARLTQALHSRDEFLASMSHELRTPLTGILGLSEMLQLDIYGPLTEKQRHAVKTVYDSGQHLLALITDILDLAKTSAGKLELQVGPVSVPDVCRASIQLVSGQARKKNLKLALNLDQAPSRLEADERRLKQILVNLLGNAVKFTPDGGQIGLEVSVDAPQGRARFVVWDTGIGIAPEMMAHLFQPFVQLDNRLNRDNVGTGLGLALVHQLVTLHGGSISLESTGRPGQGSRFTVALPWSAPAVEGFPLAADQPGPGQAAVSLPPGVAGARILVADDNATTLAILHDALAAHGFQVAVALNGFEALALARALPPALMVLDVQMPGLDGLEVARQVRADPALAAIPIIALTALVMPGDRERCLAAGANAYETKPVSLSRLLGRIGALIARGGEKYAE